ncbi:MAG: MBL fold metallo-hydrolase [Saprospiraceae bacterium]|nr:MBL fold metallo-hydrolase [Saprospiraceae bacterium]
MLHYHETHQFTLGAFKCTIIRDMMFTYQGEHYFSNVDPSEVSSALEQYNQTPEKIPSPFVSMLIELGDQKILIDTGIGYMTQPMEFQGNSIQFKGRTIEHLQALSLTPDKISHLIITHCHPDHIGGVCDENAQPFFHNAKHMIHQDEYKFWTTSKADYVPELFKYFIVQNIHPLKDVHMYLLTSPEDEVIPGITLLKVPGHTEGQVAVRIESQGEKLLFISDIWLHPLHIEHLDWQTTYDPDHQLAKKSRIQMLELAYKENMLVQSFHFDFPGLGHIDKSSKVWHWVPL